MRLLKKGAVDDIVGGDGFWLVDCRFENFRCREENGDDADAGGCPAGLLADAELDAVCGVNGGSSSCRGCCWCDVDADPEIEVAGDAVPRVSASSDDGGLGRCFPRAEALRT